MEQLQLGYPPRETVNPLSRLLGGLLALALGLGGVALLLFVVLPVLGLIISAAVGGVILTLAGLVMMVPMLLLTAGVAIFLSRSSLRRSAQFRVWR